MSVLEIKGLSKSFGKNKVVEDINITIEKGEIFGLIGKNGAGKTTIMKMVLGILKKDEGQIKVCEDEVQYGKSKTNKKIGYLPDVPAFYNYMNGKEYLKLCGEITGMSKDKIEKRSVELLKTVGLDVNRKKIGGYSRGMKQRLGIAQALLNEPELLICDEPTSALDPIGRKEILDILLSLKGRVTIVFSTHILSDVERVCDRVAVLDKSKILLDETISEVKGKSTSSGYVVELRSEEELNRLKEDEQVKSIIADVSTKGNQFTVKKQEVNKIFKRLGELNIIPDKFEIMESTLEDLFMEVTK